MAVTTGLVAAARIYAKHGIIHRDISHGNLLIAEGPTFKRCCNRWAGLIDFDMAKQDSGVDYGTVDEGKFPDRRGTLAYMAITLFDTRFKLKRHLIWFDLESYFWVAMFLTLLEADEEMFRTNYQEAFSSLHTAMNARIRLLSRIGVYKREAMAFAMSSKRQIVEDLSGSPHYDLTTDWERLHKFRSRLNPKELEEADRFHYDLEVVIYPLSKPFEYKLNTTNWFPQTSKGLKNWIDETVDGVLETMGNEEEHDEWRRTVRDHPWRVDGMD